MAESRLTTARPDRGRSLRSGGAKTGENNRNYQAIQGGLGAEIGGNFSLTMGEVLDIYVGGPGHHNVAEDGGTGGGGGGSFDGGTDCAHGSRVDA